MYLHLRPFGMVSRSYAASVPFVGICRESPQHQRAQLVLHNLHDLIGTSANHHHELREPSRRSLDMSDRFRAVRGELRVGHDLRVIAELLSNKKNVAGL